MGVARGGVRAAVIHARADHDAGGHLVVEQSANFIAEDGFKPAIEAIFVSSSVAVDAADQLAFELIESGLKFARILTDDSERGVAKGFSLQTEWIGQELGPSGSKQSVLMTETRAAA